MRGTSNSEKRMNLALVVDNEAVEESRLERWLGEPVKVLILSTNVFLVNKKNYPVLPRTVQNTVKRFFPMRCQFIIEGRGGTGHDVR